MIHVKRIYEEPDERDGYRVLVDGLWPRGVSKDDAAVDAWMREIAPSDELRRWFDHDPDKWDEFQRRYAGELKRMPEELAFLRAKGDQSTLTLVFAARDTEHNNAVALRNILSTNG